MRRIGHFLDQWFGDADSKRLSVPERFACLETAVSEANKQLNSLTRMPLGPAGLPLAPANALRGVPPLSAARRKALPLPTEPWTETACVEHR